MREQNKRLSEQIQIIRMNAKDGLLNVEEEKKRDLASLKENTDTLLKEKDGYLAHLPPEQKSFKS